MRTPRTTLNMPTICMSTPMSHVHVAHSTYVRVCVQVTGHRRREWHLLWGTPITESGTEHVSTSHKGRRHAHSTLNHADHRMSTHSHVCM